MNKTLLIEDNLNQEELIKKEIDLYRSNINLTDTESIELSELYTRYQSGMRQWFNYHDILLGSLSRLIIPIDKVLNTAESKASDKVCATSIILREVYERKKTYWDWKESDWLDIICHGYKAFANKYHSKARRQDIIYLSYFLGNFNSFHLIGQIKTYNLAKKIFGKVSIDNIASIFEEELKRWGYKEKAICLIKNNISLIFLVNYSCRIEKLNTEVLQSIYDKNKIEHTRKTIVLISRVLLNFGILKTEVKNTKRGRNFVAENLVSDVHKEWVHWCQKWYDTSTLAEKSRRKYYYLLLQIGRWLTNEHPEVVEPQQWNRDLSLEFLGRVIEKKQGDWVSRHNLKNGNICVEKPLSPRAKADIIVALRSFLRDCQEWQWISINFSPTRVLKTPQSIRKLIKPNPRTINDNVWAKLLWAGLNLTEEELPNVQFTKENRSNQKAGEYFYPIQFVKAIVIVWLFTGLRRNEICRLKVGCVRWQKDDSAIPGTNEVISKDAVCYLEIPPNKTSSSYIKPVDRVVGEAIETWEKIRPLQPSMVDKKDGSVVDFLFMYRATRVGENYINQSIIPILCKKAGISTKDTRGNITSHRARSTIATQLSTSKDPMTILELKEWLGHSDVGSTINYAKVTPTKLAKSYQDAEYFKRNLRTVEVLIDQDAITSGAATNGEPWKYYDLGHGLCTYDFFSQCKHRMACAGCGFYVPKGSSKAQILEAKDNLERMLQEIPLTEDEEFAVTEGIEALAKLKEKLADVPTPDGKTPKQLEEEKESA